MSRIFDIARKQGLIDEKCVPYTTNEKDVDCKNPHTDCNRYKIID